MFEVIGITQLTAAIWRMDVAAPRVARAAQPGQFVMVQLDPRAERIPLTIADYDAATGTVAIVIQAVGLSTRKLVNLKPGDHLQTFTGPLGRPSEMVGQEVEQLRGQRRLFVAGGVGAAPVYPQVKWLNQRDVKADVIIGARDARTLIMVDQMRDVAGNLHVATDDGSEGFRGTVTTLMRDLFEKGDRWDEVVTIGPLAMMRAVTELTREWDTPTVASLNSLMVDGTGMCGACRVTIAGQTRFTCVDGPEFDAHKIDFDEAQRRQEMYREQEQKAISKEGHKCMCTK